MNAAPEVALVFDCQGDSLVGIVTVPPAPAQVGVVIIVGGPQCRTGSHRQFTLLARELGNHGYASLRFDYRGMGDSEGEARSFESLDADIEAAKRALKQAVPGMSGVVLWGLCDAASAALLAARKDRHLAGLVLANPWVRSEATHNQTVVRHYYRARLARRDFWTKLLCGRLDLRSSAREFAQRVLALRNANVDRSGASAPSFVAGMLQGWQTGPRRLVLLSGRDLTAQEFEHLASQDRRWQFADDNPHTDVRRIPEADHTFSDTDAMRWVIEATVNWMKTLH